MCALGAYRACDQGLVDGTVNVNFSVDEAFEPGHVVGNEAAYEVEGGLQELCGGFDLSLLVLGPVFALQQGYLSIVLAKYHVDEVAAVAVGEICQDCA